MELRLTIALYRKLIKKEKKLIGLQLISSI